MDEEIIEKYARLLINKGVNLKRGEELLVNCQFEGRELALAVMREAYAAGASRVDIRFGDEAADRLKYEHEAPDTLCEVPTWQKALFDNVADKRVCDLTILSENPTAFDGISPKLLADASRARHKALEKFYNATMTNKVKWCLCAVPSLEWAQKVFPDTDGEAAVEKLWKLIIKSMRLDETDPTEAWNAHISRLGERCKKLNDAKIASLEYKSADGTDFRIALPKDYYFGSGNENSYYGVPFTANMPTEEVFTAPHRLSAQGVVHSSMPLINKGNVIDDFYIRFEDGRAVEFDAEVGRDMLEEIIETDEGSHYLGEVALVPYDSPIQSMHTLFYNTLFDENASCHLALGEAYPMVAGGADMDEEALLNVGINARSSVHVDFMIGTDDLDVTAVCADGSRLAIMHEGNFVI